MPAAPRPVRPLAVLIKALVLFLVLNLAAVWIELPLGRISAYNLLFPGRARLPFGEDQARAYNLSLFNLDAMFASHQIAAQIADDFRVVLIGDSSVWGTLLTPPQTLAGQLESSIAGACAHPARVYNLGYPTLSLTKDLLILDRALAYDPDLIIWLTTLEAFPRSRQLESPIVANNPRAVRHLIARYRLSLDPQDPAFVEPSFFDRTLIGRRRALADLLRLQVFGIPWAATGIDQTYPDTYPPAQVDLQPDASFYDLTPPTLDESRLALDVLTAGVNAAGAGRVVIVNEPMLVSRGANSDIRYNFFYPRWAYDQYRDLMQSLSARNGWRYLDLWDIVPPEEFTNSAIHLSPQGTRLLTERLSPVILEYCR